MRTSTAIFGLCFGLSEAIFAFAQCPGGVCYPPSYYNGPHSSGRGLRMVVPIEPTAPVHGTTPHDAHCRIHVGDGCIGSGTLISSSDATGLVVTCSHLFDESTSNIVVAFPDGSRFAARLLERDAANDLAALLIQRPSAQPVDVNDEQPTGVLTACGYGGNGEFRPIRGVVAGAAQAVGATFPSVKITGAVRPGDSGGGVLDSAGRLVGVVWGCREGETYLTCGQPLRRFLDRVWPGRRGQKSDFRNQEQQADVPSFDLAARLDKIEGDVDTLRRNKQDKGDYLQVGDLNGYAMKSELPMHHQQIEQRIGELRPGLFSGMSYGKLLAGALGLSGPVAFAVMVAGGLAGRRLKSRLAAHARESSNSQRSIPIAVDTPPPPQQGVPETHFVPVERDDFARAHQWASEQVARKYPGAMEMLSALDSLIKQQLAGRK